MSAPSRGSTAGFVLAGGQSRRMGRDKALLVVNNEPMLARVARQVQAAAGSAAIIGPPGRYAHLGFEVIGDRVPGSGPLGGIDTALSLGRAWWNLILACDLPFVGPEMLEALLERARGSAALCVVPHSDRPEPLCAVYSLAAAAAIRSAFDGGVRKITDALEGLPVEWHRVEHERALTNLNTADDWEAFGG
jgi:molybdopterin-guanine dinucleotide biosynthesis protein A